jgi:ribosomal protein S18 acetylase RimI-like enzyme
MDVRFEAVDGVSTAARECLRQYTAEMTSRLPEPYEEAHLVRDAEVRGRAGTFVIALNEGRAVGCAALRTLRPGVGEVRHMWVHPSARGRGLGRRLLAELEREALARDLHTLRLGTNRELTEAIGLYRGAGYQEVPRYNGRTDYSHFFAKRLPG